MKTIKLFSILLIIPLLFAYKPAHNQDGGNANKKFKFPEIKNKAFTAGEELQYRLHYGFIDAGIATLKVEQVDKKINNRSLYHVIGTGRSKGTFDWFFKVRDRYESFIDERGLFPWAFVRRVDEGGYKFSQDYIFYQQKQKVKTQDKKMYDVPLGIQDMLSAFYYARNIDYTNAEIGQIFTITTFVDGEVWPLKIKYAGKDIIKVDGVKYHALKFHPVIQSGRIFKDEDDLNVWVSDDKNKVPLLAEAKILVGSIKMELKSHKGLIEPLNRVKK